MDAIDGTAETTKEDPLLTQEAIDNQRDNESLNQSEAANNRRRKMCIYFGGFIAICVIAVLLVVIGLRVYKGLSEGPNPMKYGLSKVDAEAIHYSRTQNDPSYEVFPSDIHCVTSKDKIEKYFKQESAFRYHENCSMNKRLSVFRKEFGERFTPEEVADVRVRAACLFIHQRQLGYFSCCFETMEHVKMNLTLDDCGDECIVNHDSMSCCCTLPFCNEESRVRANPANSYFFANYHPTVVPVVIFNKSTPQ